MAERTLVENVAQVKADFKAVKDAIYSQVGYDLDNVPTNEYGNKVNDACTEMYGIGKEEGIMEGYENGKSDGIDDGYTSGKADGIYEGIEQVISNSRYIEKQASGKVIRLDDVSEVYHNVVVKADVPTEVTVCGKNLFDISTDTRLTKQADGSYVNNKLVTVTKFPLALPYGTYTYSYDLSCPTGKNGRITFILKDGTSVETYLTSNGEFKHFEKTFTGEVVNWQFNFSNLPEAETVVIKNLQLECGSSVTPYEEYNGETITATPSGTEVSSICPTMTFIADSDITVDYYGSYSRNMWWRKYLNGGAVMHGFGCFCGYRWTDATFDPPYDINLSVSTNAFYYSWIEDLRGILKKNNVNLIFSEVGDQHFNVFMHSYVTYVPYLKLPTNSSAYGWFSGCTKLKEVDGYECTEINKFESGTSTNNKTFYNCTNLEHIIFHGTIANNINLQWSTKLDIESLLSLVNCLKQYESGTESYRTKTITLSTESWALLDAYAYENFPEWSGATDWISGWYGWNCA